MYSLSEEVDMATVGYLEGTDPMILTHLASKGVETLPVSNGADNHGKCVGILTPQDNVSVIVGYLHKLTPVAGIALRPKNLLQACQLYKIKVLIIAPKEDWKDAKKVMKEVKNIVEFVELESVSDRIMELVKG